MQQDTKLKPTMKHIMLLTGEASGDQHGAEMAKYIMSKDDSIRISGMGSSQMKKAGVDVFFDSSSIAVMGIVEVLKHWGDIKKAMALVKSQLDNEKPDLLVCIDYQEFNQKMAAYAKALGIKVLFYIGPQVWAWRPKRVKKMGRIIDHMAVIFPFEVDFYRQHNVPVSYVGHPLVDKVPKLDTIAPCITLKQTKYTVGLFPGSRQSELVRILPVMLESAVLLSKIYGDEIQFVLPVAGTLNRVEVQEIVGHYEIDVELIFKELYPIIKSCDAIISCSGTVTLEIALLAVPLCVVYKLSWLSHQIMSRLMIIDHFCLVNIVAKKLVVKELLQKQANAKNIVEEIQHILSNEPYTKKMKQGLNMVKHELGQGGGSRHIAELALSLLPK